MYHCKACDSLYHPRRNPFTGDDEVLCSKCLVEARYSAYNMEGGDEESLEFLLDILDEHRIGYDY